MGSDFDENIVWQNAPPAGDVGYRFRMIRVPEKQPLEGMILSHRMIGSQVHYLNGRTLPHLREDCPCDGRKVGLRWEGYFTFQHTKTEELLILAVPLNVGGIIDGWWRKRRTLRGMKFKAWRPSQTPNGKIHILGKDSDHDPETLPKVPELERVLCRIWRLEIKPENTAADVTAKLDGGFETNGRFLPGQLDLM